ncbi:hypothetical protein DY000_02007839 [Brassica cretica]|uniref:Uncharacterized protein n=1 Tax=Brassica cretica TaxID=69181 RepID=A0ABQ7CCG2_BRACR|nr:hypothetical protein DY000_02007839 [Brassica cretica]
MIGNPGRFTDDAGTVIWLFPGGAKDDQEDLPGDEILATDQGARGRMASENGLAVGIRSPVLLYLVFKEKSRARFIALPVAKSHSKVFDFLKNCGVCVSVGHRRCFDQAFCGYELEKTLISQRSRIYAKPHGKQSEHERALATRAVGEFPSSNNLRLQNLVESQLKITKTESCLNALSAKFSLKKSLFCLSPRTPYILAPRLVYAFPLLPLSRHSSKMEIFQLRDYLRKLHIYPRKLDIYLAL